MKTTTNFPAEAQRRGEGEILPHSEALPLCASASLRDTADPLLCGFSIAAPSAATDSFMYMPGGLHTITPSQGGKPVSVEVMVDAAAADQLNQQLGAINAKSRKRAYLDFDHADGKASFWPSSFEWRNSPEPGVYVSGEWTASGKAAIEGRDYRGFSPVFYVDDVKAKPARIVCRADAKPNMGGLVNDPAFAAIKPFFAHQARETAGASSDAVSNQTTIMTPEQIAALQAKNAELLNEITTFKEQQSALKAKNESDALVAAQISARESEIKANTIALENEALKAKATKLEADAKTRAEADADAAIKAAVAKGSIAPKDEETQKKWKALICADATAAQLLAAIPGAPALAGRIIPAGAQPDIRVGQISARDAVKAYGEIMAKQRGEGVTLGDKRALSLEAGSIFARELGPKSGVDDMPLVGANSLGSLVGVLITQRTLELLRIQFPVLSRVSTDFSAESVNYSQTIRSRVTSVPTVGTYSTSTGYAQTDETSTDADVTINRHKHVQTTLNANNLSGTARNLFEEYAPANAYAIAKEMVDYLYTLFLAAAFTNTATVAALADFSRASVIDMGTQLNINGNPMGPMNRTLLLYSTYFGKLASDAAIISLAAFQDSKIITDGSLPNVHGFTVVDAPNLPTNSENLVGFGFTKSAALLAARLPQDYTTVLPGAAFGNIQVVTNPDTGFSLMHVEYVDHTLGTANQRDAWMYGAAAGQALAAQRLTSS